MSNEKVLRRKQEKYNRKRNEVKRKIKDVIVGVSVALIIVAMLGVMGYQIFDDYIKYDTIQKIDLTAMVEAMGKVESASVEEEKVEDAEVTTEDGHDHDEAEESKEDSKEDSKKDSDKEKK